MMPAGVAPTGAGEAMATIQTRIAAIQARLEGLVPATQDAAFELPTARTAANGNLAEAASFVTAAAGDATTATGGATTVDPSRLPDAARAWLPSIEQAARSAGVDPALLTALVQHESNFDQSTVSHAGAIGLAQLMPGTAEWMGVDPHDPQANLAGGARYLKEQLDRFGEVDLALAAYNAGPNRVTQAGGIPRIAETQAYVQRVLNTWEQLR